MSEEELLDLSIGQLGDRITSRQVSVAEVVDSTLDRIERVGKTYNSMITVTADRARGQARALDAMLAAGVNLGPLHGIPISLKDNIAAAGVRTTAGSEILKDWIPDQNAAVLDRLTEAGAVLIGKNNLYEFAFGAPHRLYGPTGNPWNPAYGCGGSSSGSASAVGTGFSYGSIGTDTGGSIRIPASYCGVVGFKPTYGRVSRAGVVPLSTNMDHVGPLARTVRDAGLLLQAMSGSDETDPTTINHPPADFTSLIGAGVKGLRLGVLAPQPTERMQRPVRDALKDAYHELEDAGAHLVEVPLPDLTEVRAACWTIMRAEAAEYHRSYLRSQAHLYHPTVRNLIEAGEFIPATEYIHAQRVRRKVADDVQTALSAVDALLMPGTAMASYPIGQPTVDLDGTDESVLDAMTRYTPLFNLTGHPALVLPCGFNKEGMPISIQVVGRHRQESMVLRVAHTYEQLTEWHLRRPKVAERALN
jgi:aspartyl-tRNA(Asn)/glutamyl-tRNA(Gln) amidotransferase subunit A